MGENVWLLGADDVKRAGVEIGAAARTMREAIGAMEAALLNHQQFLDDWLARFQSAMEEASVRPDGVVTP